MAIWVHFPSLRNVRELWGGRRQEAKEDNKELEQETLKERPWALAKVNERNAVGSSVDSWAGNSKMGLMETEHSCWRKGEVWTKLGAQDPLESLLLVVKRRADDKREDAS